MSDEIKVGRLARDSLRVEMKTTRVEGEAIKLSFPLTSEYKVERWFGTEVLSHDKSAIRMDRLKSGAAPLLFNHDWSDPIGMIDGARIEGGRLWVDAHLFATARAAEVAAMVEGGLHNVSCGYEIYELTEDTKGREYTVTDWEPFEGSICTVPADPSVGIGRSADDGARPVRVVRSATTNTTHAVPATPKEKATMAEAQAAAGAAETHITRLAPAEVEKERRQAIQNLCRAARVDPRTEERWIYDGTSLADVSTGILEIQEERAKAKPLDAGKIGLSRNDTQRYSIFRAIKAIHYGAKNPEYMREAAFEIECSNHVAKRLNRNTSGVYIPADILTRAMDHEHMQRAMATTPGSKGGFLVQTDNMGFIDILRNRSVAMNMGARVISGLEGNVSFARQTGKASVTWQGGEGVSVAAGDQALGQLSMTPKTAVAITDVSEQLLKQANSPSAEAFVMGDLAADIAIDGVDAAVINGTGGSQPLGIKNTTGITSGQDAATVTYAKALAFVSTAAGANAIRANPGWVTNAAGAAVLMQRSRFANTDTPLWEGNILDGICVGFRGMSSEQLAANNLIFGSWGEVIIGEWGVLELATDNGGTRFNQMQVGIRASWMVDVLVRYPQAFVVSVNLS